MPGLWVGGDRGISICDEVMMALEKEKQRLNIKAGAGHHGAEASVGRSHCGAEE